MAEIPKDKRMLLFGMGVKWHAIVSIILNLAGIACLTLGIITAATGKWLGMSANSWLLTAIALIVFSLSAWQTAYHAAREGYEK